MGRRNCSKRHLQTKQASDSTRSRTRTEQIYQSTRCHNAQIMSSVSTGKRVCLPQSEHFLLLAFKIAQPSPTPSSPHAGRPLRALSTHALAMRVTRPDLQQDRVGCASVQPPNFKTKPGRAARPAVPHVGVAGWRRATSASALDCNKTLYSF